MIIRYIIKNEDIGQYYGMYHGEEYFTKDINDSYKFLSEESALQWAEESVKISDVKVITINKVYINNK